MYWPELIKQRREMLGLTQTELAVKAGVSLPSVQNMEAGKANPALKTLESVMSVLEVEISFTLKSVGTENFEKRENAENQTPIVPIVQTLAEELPGLAKGSARERAHHLFKLLEKLTDKK